jgi:hypothetical protein
MTKENAAKREAAKKPGRDDVHEQREQGQRREGVVREGTSLIDRERADWEGMVPAGPRDDDDGGSPTPGPSSLAGAVRPKKV